MNKVSTTRTTKICKPTLIMPDKHMKEHLAEPWLFKIETANKHNASNETVFLVLSLSMLNNKMAKEFDPFTAVFVQADINTNAIFDKVDSKQARTKFYLFDKWQDLNRILRAWIDDAQDCVIATAWIENDQLVIKDCALKQYRIAFDIIPALKKMSVANRSKFQIQQFGNYLHWTEGDVHLDLDTVRYHCDKKYKDTKDLEAITYYKNYGRAIASLRKQYGLTQNYIESLVGLSARQLYRVESGEQEPTIKLLEKLAKAHKLKVNDYLHKLADLLSAKD